jgi:hypothetical protein
LKMKASNELAGEKVIPWFGGKIGVGFTDLATKMCCQRGAKAP